MWVHVNFPGVASHVTCMSTLVRGQDAMKGPCCLSWIIRALPWGIVFWSQDLFVGTENGSLKYNHPTGFPRFNPSVLRGLKSKHHRLRHVARLNEIAEKLAFAIFFANKAFQEENSESFYGKTHFRTWFLFGFPPKRNLGDPNHPPSTNLWTTCSSWTLSRLDSKVS